MRTTLNDPDRLTFIPGASFPDSEIRAELGLLGFTGNAEPVEVGPNGQPGWVLSQNGATYQPDLQTWMPCGRIWRGRQFEAIEEAA